MHEEVELNKCALWVCVYVVWGSWTRECESGVMSGEHVLVVPRRWIWGRVCVLWVTWTWASGMCKCRAYVVCMRGCVHVMRVLRSLFFFLSLDLILPILSVDLIRHRSSPFLNPTSYQMLISHSDLITQLPTCDYLAFALIPLRSHRHASILRRTCIYLTFIA